MSEKTLVRPVFTGQELRKLILPLVLEQFLAVTVGMADTMMVSTVGEAAVSGISLVDQANLLLIQVFAAMATGGAVVASQYLDPFTYSDDAVTQGAWNLAQSNDLWVVSATNMGGAVICPWDDRMASDGYVIRPNDFYPIGCHIDLEKFWQLHQRENILQGLNRGVLKKYKEFLMR